MALIDIPTSAVPATQSVLSRVYTGPWGHAANLALLADAGDYLTGLFGKPIGVVDGYTEVKGTPNTPLRSRVRLMRERDGKVVRETFSHPTTGYYRFERLGDADKYTVLTYHPTRDYRAVVADNLTPEVAP